MSNNVRIFIESNLVPSTEVHPTIKGLFNYAKESGKVYYKHTAKDKFKFTKEDYALIKQHFANECAEITLTIETKCNGVFGTYWAGYFQMLGAKDNQDKCIIEVSVKPLDAYKCFDKGLEITQNIFNAGLTVSTKAIAGIIEEETCTTSNPAGTCDDFYEAYFNPLSTCLAEPSDWCSKSNVVELDGDPNNGACDPEVPHLITQTTTWHREIIEIPCELGIPVPPALPGNWQLVENNCGSTNTSIWWRCPNTSSGIVVGPYSRGRLFENVLIEILDNMACDLVIKSNFFNINPDGNAPVNLAYAFAEEYCHHITVHQKSDIKNPSVLTPSTAPSWNLTPKDFFSDLWRMFRVTYVIENGVFILEHISSFVSSLGKDLTTVKMSKVLEYSTPDDVKYENYYWPEDTSLAFKANSIIYDCGEKTKEERNTLVHTDLGYIQNPINSEKVSDSGFVLIANILNGSDLIIYDNNSPFQWVNLHDNLHTYGRLYKSGSINGASQVFDSWDPYIKQEKFSIYPCCSEEPFNPLDLITTSLGIASVASAEENIFTNKLELDLAY